MRSIDSKSEDDLIDEPSRDDDLVQEDNSMNLRVDENDEPHDVKSEIGEFDPMLFTLNYPALELFPSQVTKTPSYCFRSVTTCIRQHLKQPKRVWRMADIQHLLRELNTLHNRDENVFVQS